MVAQSDTVRRLDQAGGQAFPGARSAASASLRVGVHQIALASETRKTGRQPRSSRYIGAVQRRTKIDTESVARFRMEPQRRRWRWGYAFSQEVIANPARLRCWRWLSATSTATRTQPSRGADAAERTTLPQLVRAGHERLRPAGDQRRRRRCAPRGDHVLANALVTPLGGKEQAGGDVGMGTPIVS
jgi:hypothetical protein